MKQFKGRVITPGEVTAEAVVTTQGFNTLASLQMALHHRESAFVAVYIEVLAAAKLKRLVHTDMDAARAEAFADGFDHVVDQLVGALVVDQQRVIDLKGGLLPP